MHVCLCMYVCMHAYVCIHICMYAYMFICTYILMHVYTSVHVHVYACTCVCTVYMHVHMYVHDWMYTLCMLKHVFPPIIASSTRALAVSQGSCFAEVTDDQNGMYLCLQLQALRKGYVNNPVLPRQ